MNLQAHKDLLTTIKIALALNDFSCADELDKPKRTIKPVKWQSWHESANRFKQALYLSEKTAYECCLLA